MAVTGVLKKCADCGTVFVAENPASKYCPCCSARRNIPGPVSYTHLTLPTIA